MLTRLIPGALFAGLCAGAIAALLQLTFVVPLIHQGELYETGVLIHFPAAAEAHDQAAMTEDAVEDQDPTAAGSTEDDVAAEIGSIPFDLRRSIGTFGNYMISYIGFALLMVAGFAIAERYGHRVTARTGVIWGLCGFLAVQLAPAFGLPPELPGGTSAPLELRQVWWTQCVLVTIAGIGLLAFGKGPLAIAAAMILIALPHLIGAPEAPFGGVSPPELSAHFTARVLGAGAVCWAVLGTSAGAIWARDRPA